MVGTTTSGSLIRPADLFSTITKNEILSIEGVGPDSGKGGRRGKCRGKSHLEQDATAKLVLSTPEVTLPVPRAPPVHQDTVAGEVSVSDLQAFPNLTLQLAFDARGCRKLQSALDLADDAGRTAVAQQLKGHICDATNSPHANHVLQRCIELLRPCSVEFVLKELEGWGAPGNIARHVYGCRVVERLIEHFPPKWIAGLLDSILDEASALCRHTFGNFVIQHVLEHGTREQRQRIVDALCEDLGCCAMHEHAGGVLDKALTYGALEDQRDLAQKVLSCPGLLSSMHAARGGTGLAAQRLLKVVDGEMLAEAKRQLGEVNADAKTVSRFTQANREVQPNMDNAPSRKSKTRVRSGPREAAEKTEGSKRVGPKLMSLNGGLSKRPISGIQTSAA